MARRAGAARGDSEAGGRRDPGEPAAGAGLRPDRAPPPATGDTSGVDAWYLTAAERGNPWTAIDRPHGPAGAWSTANAVRPLVHGAAYFAELLGRVRDLAAGDLLLFTDWRGDPDERLDGPGTEVARVFGDAARRGVVVKGLVWRSHLDRLQFSSSENRHLGEALNAAGGECRLDARVRPGGSHHQKFVVLRHPGRPDHDAAFVGGIDLCHSRRDDAGHAGDPQRQAMASVYGDRPPWHDIQLLVRGPAVADIETVFRERWDDPSPLSRNPVRRLRDRLQLSGRGRPTPLAPMLPAPEPAGTAAVQLLRTYPLRHPGYPFARRGERSVARGYLKALRRARALVYLEDQYFWSAEVAGSFAAALAAHPSLHLVAVLPRHPDQDGRLSEPPNLVGHLAAAATVLGAAPDRVDFYSIENGDGVPVYVHAKACVIDDVWSCVGSDNFNRRSWTHDSELGCAVIDDARDPREPADPGGLGDGARVFARDLRVGLAREHLGRAEGDDRDLIDPAAMVRAFAAGARALDAWHGGGRRGPRPAGQLRRLAPPVLRPRTQLWAQSLYRVVYDPDGRSPRMRRRGQF